MLKRILFVDDEPLVLMGLQRSLRSMREEWEMVFANGGPAALEAIGRQTFDIVVTDMKMPGMDGAQVLEEVKKRSPQTLRMILSGQADRETVLRCVNPAHQYLSKPCEGEELKGRLLRAFALRDLLGNQDVTGIVSRLDSLPSLPTLYLELTEELRSPEPSVAKVSRLISADIAMTAKILQLVNSAFFGLRHQVSDASRAVGLLGFDIVKSLVLSTHIFSEFQTALFTDADLKYLWEHSLASANYAKRLAMHENAEQQMVDDCFTAALLHDAGKLIMASALHDGYKTVLEKVRTEGKGVYEAEREILGCSHAEVAAYLFGLWNLPGQIIEAVAWHHTPAESHQSGFSAVTAVHVASIYHEQRNSWMQDRTPVDYEFLSKTDCLEREKSWRKYLDEEETERKDHERKDSVC